MVNIKGFRLRKNIRKKISKLLSEARNAAKPDKCILCGKPQTSFCNSHSVPQLSLRNIASDGTFDVFDMSENVRMQYMHLAILPLQTESVVLAFYHKRDKLYRKLRHTINNSSEEKVLQFLNYLVFAYTENYFISKNIRQKIETDEKLSLLGQENNGNPSLGFLSPDNYFGMGYQPIRMEEIPNFLSAEWAVI